MPLLMLILAEMLREFSESGVLLFRVGKYVNSYFD